MGTDYRHRGYVEDHKQEIAKIDVRIEKANMKIDALELDVATRKRKIELMGDSINSLGLEIKNRKRKIELWNEDKTKLSGFIDGLNKTIERNES